MLYTALNIIAYACVLSDTFSLLEDMAFDLCDFRQMSDRGRCQKHKNNAKKPIPTTSQLLVRPFENELKLRVALDAFTVTESFEN